MRICALNGDKILYEDANTTMAATLVASVAAKTDLTGATFHKVIFEGDTDLTAAILPKSNFEYCTFTGVVTLTRANLAGSNLLTSAFLRTPLITYSDLRGVRMPQMTGDKWCDAGYTGCLTSGYSWEGLLI